MTNCSDNTPSPNSIWGQTRAQLLSHFDSHVRVLSVCYQYQQAEEADAWITS